MELPSCVDTRGHKFVISLWHKDRAVCERCGFIRQQSTALGHLVHCHQSDTHPYLSTEIKGDSD